MVYLRSGLKMVYLRCGFRKHSVSWAKDLQFTLGHNHGQENHGPSTPRGMAISIMCSTNLLGVI